MTRLAACILSLPLFLTPCATAVAATAAPQPALVRAMTVDQLRTIPAALGHAIVDKPEGSADEITARSGDGQEYSLRGALCDSAKGCKVVVIQAWIDHSPIAPERLNEANLNVAAVSTVYDTDQGMLRIARLVILEGGVSRANLGANVDAVLSAVPAVLQIVDR